jgi:hypothetical protein
MTCTQEPFRDWRRRDTHIHRTTSDFTTALEQGYFECYICKKKWRIEEDE